MRNASCAVRLMAMALVLVLCMTAAAAAQTAQEERNFDGKVLATMEMEASADEIYTFFTEMLNIPIQDFIC